MRRTVLILIAMASVAATRPVGKPTGWTAQQRACPARQISAELTAKVVKSMLPGENEDEVVPAASDGLDDLAAACARQTNVSKARVKSYRDLANWIGMSAALADAIKARGIDPTLLSTAMDIGPGRANHIFDMTGDQVAQALAALKAQGVDFAGLSEDTKTLIGAYLSSVSHAWQSK